jgi:hypothetical protein
MPALGDLLKSSPGPFGTQMHLSNDNNLALQRRYSTKV